LGLFHVNTDSDKEMLSSLRSIDGDFLDEFELFSVGSERSDSSETLRGVGGDFSDINQMSFLADDVEFGSKDKNGRHVNVVQ